MLEFLKVKTLHRISGYEIGAVGEYGKREIQGRGKAEGQVDKRKKIRGS